MRWDQIFDRVTPHVVKIETPGGHGTGFLCLRTDAFCGISTAHHVVAHADDWQQPIRIRHHPSGSTTLLREAERVIFIGRDRDSAMIVVPQNVVLQLPETPIPLLSANTVLPIGADVGWIGYPAVHRTSQCFFSGKISAFHAPEHMYLIDGVAINGVSGGPVVHADAPTTPHIVGSISDYIANRATGEVLPGLSGARDVSHLHEVVSAITTWDELRTAARAAAGQEQG